MTRLFRRIKIKKKFVLFGLPFFLGGIVNSHADDLDTLQFSASVRKTWDDNLFKRSINQSSDQITTSSAGVRFDKSYSLQRFIGNVEYVDNKYKNNDFLNFDTVNYSTAWLWSLTPSITGTLSSSRNRSLAGFADFRSFAQNIRTTEVNQFRAEYSPHQVWKLIAGMTNSTASNSQTFNAIPNFDYNAFDFGAGYNFSSGTNATFLGHKRSGSYNRPINTFSLIDSGYSESEYELDIVFKATGKSSLSTKVAYLARDYDNFTERDYGAWMGFVRYNYELTGKLNASAELGRTIGVFESNYSTYAVTDALTASLDYRYSSKIKISINSRFAQRDFKQPVTDNLPTRSDDESSFGGVLSWEPVRAVDVSLRSTFTRRNAHGIYNQFDYDDTTTSVSVEFKI